jgi:hypothetical protein
VRDNVIFVLGLALVSGLYLLVQQGLDMPHGPSLLLAAGVFTVYVGGFHIYTEFARPMFEPSDADEEQ